MEGLIKAHLQGIKTFMSQVRFDVRAIVSPVCIEWWLRKLIITVTNDLFLQGKQKEEVWCQYQACLLSVKVSSQL